jgi:hypothetical protein
LVAGGAAGRSVGREVVRAQISFGFDDATDEDFAPFFTEDEFSQQIAGDATWIAIEEGTG